jgi:beta-glucosidase
MDRAEPLFPFGFGLSYTTFHYSDLVVERSRATADLKVLVTFRVTNTGARPGFAVPQIYLGYPDITEGNEPPLELKGFQKVTLQPGETKLVHVALDKRAFSYWSVAAGSWKLANGSFKIALGSSSEDILQTAEITLH